MALVQVCDGCGKRSSEPLLRVGVIRRGDYCSGCQDAAERYLAERDALHTRVAKEAQALCEELNVRYLGRLRELPL